MIKGIVKGIVKGLVLGVLISFILLALANAQAKMPRDFQVLTVRNMQVGETGFCKVKSIVVNEKGLTFLEASAEISKSMFERANELTSEYVIVTKESDGYIITILKRPSRGWLPEHIYNEKDRIDRGDLLPVKSILQSFNN